MGGGTSCWARQPSSMHRKDQCSAFFDQTVSHNTILHTICVQRTWLRAIESALSGPIQWLWAMYGRIFLEIVSSHVSLDLHISIVACSAGSVVLYIWVRWVVNIGSVIAVRLMQKHGRWCAAHVDVAWKIHHHKISKAFNPAAASLRTGHDAGRLSSSGLLGAGGQLLGLSAGAAAAGQWDLRAVIHVTSGARIFQCFKTRVSKGFLEVGVCFSGYSALMREMCDDLLP